MFATAKYMIQCANTFFRVCRASGIFLSGVERARALANGMDMNDTWLGNFFFEQCMAEVLARLVNMSPNKQKF